MNLQIGSILKRLGVGEEVVAKFKAEKVSIIVLCGLVNKSPVEV